MGKGRKAVAAAEVEVGDDVAAGVGAGVEKVDVGMGSVVAGHFAEVAVGAENSGSVFDVEAKNEFRPGDCVEEASAEKFARACRVGKLLVEEKEVVAEIEICFPRIRCRE